MADNPTDSHYDELDRLAARSLAAREGTAAAEARASRRRPVWPWVLTGLLFAFVLGLVGSPLFEREVRGTLPPALRDDMQMPADPRVDGLVERVARLEAERARPGPGAQPLTDAPGTEAAGLGLRLQAVESRAVAAETNDANLMARLDALAAEVARTSSAVVETDTRTRDLFLLSVVRRMVEAGRPLTPIAQAVETRFRSTDGAAVEALAAWSSAPQTRRTLQGRLETIGELPPPAEAGSWWERLKARLSGLVTVRGEAAGKADAQALMAQARTAMASGDVALAVSALEAGDWPPAVRQWVQDARVLMSAEEALARLETNALEAGVGALQVTAAP
jgi:hypothetical protein